MAEEPNNDPGGAKPSQNDAMPDNLLDAIARPSVQKAKAGVVSSAPQSSKPAQKVNIPIASQKSEYVSSPKSQHEPVKPTAYGRTASVSNPGHTTQQKEVLHREIHQGEVHQKEAVSHQREGSFQQRETPKESAILNPTLGHKAHYVPMQNPVSPRLTPNKPSMLIVADTFIPKRDGVMKFLSEMIPRLAEDYSLTLLVPKYSDDIPEQYLGVRVIGIPVGRFSLAGYSAARMDRAAVRSAVSQNDIIFAHSGMPLGVLATLAAKKERKPVVTYLHQIPWEQMAAIMTDNRILKWAIKKVVLRLSRWILNKNTLLLVPSAALAKLLQRNGFKAPMLPVQLGVGDEFTKPDDNLAAKKALGIEPRYFVIGYTGRISAEKSVATLQDAFERIYRNNKNIFLLIVGGGKKNDVERLRNIPNCRVSGFVPDVTPYLQAMDVFVMPSLTETTSLATLEAMASGLPVVVTPLGNMKEYVVSGQNGYFFPKRNVPILVDRLNRLIEDKPLRQRLGANARSAVRKQYTWDKTALNVWKALEMARVGKRI